MNILGVQLVLLGFAFFMVYVLFIHWSKRNISNLTFGSWIIIWAIFFVFVLFPKILEPLIKDLFIIRVMDLGMIVAFMVLTYISIENNIKIKKNEKQLEMLIRQLAIKKYEDKKTKN
jgi:hypothetical protein